LQLTADVSNDVVNIETDSLDENNTELPLLRNPPILEATEDLTSLSYLNEPAVLHAIKVRYSQLNIYTYSGIVLIATNPFQRVDQMYSADIIQAYSGKRRGEQEPHLFAIAEDAYRCMKEDQKDQTIVVSGESGAGKTVSAKYIMRYFASVEEITNSDSFHSNSKIEMSETEQQILATNPIMEAFGNAKTTRNDNSSRFGKYLEILFNDKTAIIGARIRTYLLERSRLVFQPKSERNYHIFYQIMEGLSDDQKAQLKLTNVEDFNYLNQGGDHHIQGVDDKSEYKDTSEALSLIGIDSEKQFAIFTLLAALLHVGNIEVKATRNDAILSSDEPNLIKAAELLKVDPFNFAKWVTKKQIVTRSEKIVSNLNHKQALVARDSVAKYIYSALFDWLVAFINQDLCPPEVASQVKSFIGVLDIYGFEHFEKNSFEQFCINYANEKLQQEFNQHVFKLEQEEYINEKIEWSFIEFSDNQPCIDLIEQKLGILSLLDEESRLPSGNDESWIHKLYDNLDKPPTNKVFKKPRFGQTKFTVAHYALDVSYDIEGFTEKNRDSVSEGHLEVLKESKNELLTEILEALDAANAKAEEASAAAAAAVSKRPGPNKAVKRKPTLGSIFKGSLIELMKTIDSTNVHYIRCIKPNEDKEAWKFDPLMVLSQLRACGVLETIKISCAGFPSRWTYEEFASRYHLLLTSSEYEELLNGNATEESTRVICDLILNRTVEKDDKYQLGLTKIFFKAGMLAHLEKLRTDKLNASATLVQKNIRGVYYRRKYVEIRDSIMKLQSLIIGYNARARVQQQIEFDSATTIQTLVRAKQARKRFTAATASIAALQNLIRAKQARLRFLEGQKERGIALIQNSLRSYSDRSQFLKQRKAAIVTQTYVRVRTAKKELQKLKVEAKSVNRLKEASYKLEGKVIELNTRLSDKVSENKSLVAELLALKATLVATQKGHDELKEREVIIKKQKDEDSDSHLKQIEELNADVAKSKEDLLQSAAKITELTELQTQLKEEVKDTLEQLMAAREELSKRDVTEQDLKSEVDSLRQQVEQLSKQARSGSTMNGKAVAGLPTTPKRSRRYSTQSQERESQLFSPKQVSVIPISNQEEDTESTLSSLSSITNELYALLQDSKTLYKEIIDGLLRNLNVPQSGVMTELTKKEVLFPARIIIIILSDMWRLGLTKDSESFLGQVLQTIQQIVSGLKEEEIIIQHGAFWLSNVHELYSFVSYAELTILENEDISNEMGEDEYSEYLKLVAVVKEDFETLSYNIYNMWMKKIEKELEKKVVSAVVMSQSLPGFITTEASPFFSKVFSQNVQYKMDDILGFFNNVFYSLKNYLIEPEAGNRIIIELLRFINAVCFNDLIMRRNYLSWKRGLQLNYNVTRLEEWCKSHEIPNSSNYLLHLLQAAKLLQLKKNSKEDIEIIFEICYALKPVQIQRLLASYAVADYESPLDQNVLAIVADRVKEQGESSDDYFETVSKDALDDPFRQAEIRPFTRVEAYVPAWLNLPTVRRIVELVTKNAAAQEYLNQQAENGDLIEGGEE
jgi:myosin-5